MAIGIVALIVGALFVAFLVLRLVFEGYVEFISIWSRTRSMARGINPPYETDVKFLKRAAGTGISLAFALLPCAAIALAFFVLFEGNAVPDVVRYGVVSVLSFIALMAAATGWVVGRKFYISMSMVAAVIAIPMALIIGIGVIAFISEL